MGYKAKQVFCDIVLNGAVASFVGSFSARDVAPLDEMAGGFRRFVSLTSTRLSGRA